MIFLTTQLKQIFSDASFVKIMELKGEIFRALEGRRTQRIQYGDDVFFVKHHFGVGWKEILKNIFPDCASTALWKSFYLQSRKKSFVTMRFFFLLLAGWNLDLLFLQLDNLASRYVAADAARRLAFGSGLEFGFLALAGAITLARLPRFVRDAAGALAREERL